MSVAGEGLEEILVEGLVEVSREFRDLVRDAADGCEHGGSLRSGVCAETGHVGVDV